MGLIQALKLKFKPVYEVEPDRYYSEFLREEDAQNLRPFVEDFVSRLSVPSAILAVGTSAFPSAYWNMVKKMNEDNPGSNLAEAYRDVDLLVVPEEVVKLEQLESAIQEALIQMDYSFKEDYDTDAGVSFFTEYVGDKKRKVEWRNIDYGLHSVSSNLRNGTGLDLILGRDDLLEKTAAQKIAEERKYKNPFSLLYDGSTASH